MTVKAKPAQSLPAAIAEAERQLVSLQTVHEIAKNTVAGTKQELDKAKAEKAVLANPASFLRRKAKAKKTAKSLTPLDHLPMVNNVADNDEKLMQLSKRVRSCTAAHSKARRHVSLPVVRYQGRHSIPRAPARPFAPPQVTAHVTEIE